MARIVDLRVLDQDDQFRAQYKELCEQSNSASGTIRSIKREILQARDVEFDNRAIRTYGEQLGVAMISKWRADMELDAMNYHLR